MVEKRDHQRINCAEKCLLYHDKSKYGGAVMNISISGALVSLLGSDHGVIVPGDTCSLILYNDPTTSFFRYKSRVARINQAGVGVEILELDY